MDRRGFLKRISAAAAAFTAASALPARAAAAAPKATGVSVSANTSKFEQTIGEAGRQVVELLRQCRVVDYAETVSTHRPTEVRVVFEPADESAPRTDKDVKAWKLVEAGALKSLTVTQTAAAIDSSHLGYAPIVVEKPHYEIEATWLVNTEIRP